MKEEEKLCCSHKTKERSEKEYKDLIHRLNRIEGQIRGIKGMVEKNAYCRTIYAPAWPRISVRGRMRPSTSLSVPCRS